MILSVWGKFHESIEGLELKIVEEKSEIPSDRPWGAALDKAPQEGLCVKGPGVLRQAERLRLEYVRHVLDLCVSHSAKVI